MTQGSIVNTGNPLDVAIEGEGYFVVSDGEQQLYTRAGAFGVDENGNLVDPATGYRVQRIGLTGEADGFQITGDSSIRVPYDVSPCRPRPPPRSPFTGNLSSDATGTAKAQKLAIEPDLHAGTAPRPRRPRKSINSTSSAAAPARVGSWAPAQPGPSRFSGYHKDGTALSTRPDVCGHGHDNGGRPGQSPQQQRAHRLHGVLRQRQDSDHGRRNEATAGPISRCPTRATARWRRPPYFELTTVGGDEFKNVNIAVYDSQGGKHVLSAALVRTDTVNTWDMVLTSITGNVLELNPADRRINGLTFDPQSGAFFGIARRPRRPSSSSRSRTMPRILRPSP